ncbi:Putative L,D-transpeptidase YkuD [Legionella massiliensis]|uniref:Putative L,D-transpeptidase YkuD n=1 Tax=Legionella massiliensis TaxID=1034943 RepID=A0A078L2L1_9GAMM|nr:L,D-transpeptidase [Legionella massiliensis]CDZ78253.1 Putative L,D-transpeptidase YkuD [Legionella massiliensis]CEE13991.1 Putative L,D-transpeptidase YkuD [Legionella massiliensis]
MIKEISTNQLIFVAADEQKMYCYKNDKHFKSYPISTGKNGLGELEGSECTPRGWHSIHSRIGLDAAINSVFVSREWTGEIYSQTLAEQFPGRDWILSRILQLDGLEEGRNKGGKVDSLQRYIYIHGTPDTTELGKPGSRGCIRMRNSDVIELANWVEIGTSVCIE